MITLKITISNRFEVVYTNLAKIVYTAPGGTMKKLLTLILGNLGLLISATIMSIASWFLLPIGVEIAKGGHALSNLIGWIFICPIAFCFFLSTLSSSLTLIIKGVKTKKWVWLILGVIIFIFDIAILIISLI